MFVAKSVYELAWRTVRDVRSGTRTLPRMALYFSVVAAVTPLAAAPGIQDHASIREAAASFLEQQTAHPTATIQIEVGRLDERLTLAACSGKLATFLPPGGRATGNLTVGVRCDAPKPWTIYLSANVKVLAPVAVARRALPRGVMLQAGDLEMIETDIASLTAGYVDTVQEAAGKQLKTALTKGSIVSPRQLEQPRLVRRGERVTISARTGGIDIRMEGKALADGIHGERIRVQNLGSRRVIDATVVSAGTVEVQM